MVQSRLAIDVGGTFTDVFIFNEETGEVFVTKTSSTPTNPEQGILNGIDKAQLKGQDIKVFSHGTTVGTNALIERKLPKTALVTTKGFRDVTEIRRGTKEDIWDMYEDTAKPYIKRRDRFEVLERVDYEGNILEVLDEEEMRNLARKLKRRETESVAICFINSYMNGENELKAKKSLKKKCPMFTFVHQAKYYQKYLNMSV